MGTTYYVNRSMTVFGSYICSECKSVILVQFHLKSGGASTWSQAKASEVMDEATQKLLEALQDFPEKPFLVTKTYDGRTFTTGYEMELDQADKGCPFCGHKELWQQGAFYADACRMDPKTGVSLVTNVPEESRMRVFSSLDAAKEWAANTLAQKAAQIRQHWIDNPDEEAATKAQISDLKNEVAALEPQKADVKAKSQHIFAQIEKKEAEMKGYSLFSPDRKTAKIELKELKKAYDAQRTTDLEQEKKLNGEIDTLQKQLKKLYVANPGVMNEVETLTGKGMDIHQAYRLN